MALKRTTQINNQADADRVGDGIKRVKKFPCWVTWTDERNKTAEQLAYFYGVVIPAIQDHLESTGDGTRWKKDDLAEWFKAEFLPDRVVMVDGKAKIVQTGISRLKVKEMSEFIDAVIRYMAQQGCQIPEAE